MDLYDYLTENIKKPRGFLENLPIDILEIRQGYIRARLNPMPGNANPFGTVHGGCYYAVADTVAGTAGMTYGHYVTTTTGHIHYLCGASVEEPLMVETTEIKAGHNIMTYDVTFSTKEGKIVCRATLEYYVLGKILLEDSGRKVEREGE